MTRVKTILAVMLAVLWTVVGVHCQIEAVTGLEGLRCDSQPSSPVRDSHCADTHCVPIEQGQYHGNQSAPLKPIPPVVTVVSSVVCNLLNDHCLTVVRLEPDDPAPPRPWQFYYRTALPPRAPSRLS